MCRWSTWDALKSGEKPREDLPATIQERAWSSPIWYVPDNEGITALDLADSNQEIRDLILKTQS